MVRRGFLVAVVGFVLALAPPASAQSTYTWTGAASPTTPDWSVAGNWTPGVPTLGSILSFPALDTSVCTTCYASTDDFNNASVDGLVVDDGVGYEIKGAGFPLEIGAGGIQANTGGNAFNPSTLTLPVVLSASQDWTIDGGTDHVGGLDLIGGLTATPSGGEPLGVTLKDEGSLGFGGDNEVGAVSVAGAVPTDTGGNSFLNGTVLVIGGLNANGNPVKLTDARLNGYGATVGPVTSTGGEVEVGLDNPADTTNTMAVDGSVVLDSASAMVMFINEAGTSPGVDYSQLNASGAVDLNNAQLGLYGPGASGCPVLNPGDVDTLITAAGGISGTFAGVPDGTLVPLTCAPGSPYLRINYTSTTVTATPVPFQPVNVAVPTITGIPQQGQTLTEQHGTWTNNPTGYTYQWTDCNSSGNSCTPIPGATGQTYTLSPGDVADTVRVAEVASNAGGPSGPAYSPATAAVLPLTVALPPGAPTVSTGTPTATGTQTAAFTATLVPNGRATTVVFQYGLDPRYTGTAGPVVYDQQTPAQTVGADFTSHTVTAAVSGLLPNALYHVRVVASNTAGTVDGQDQTFTTQADAPPPPPVLGKALNAKPVSGLVFVKPPPGKSLKGAGDPIANAAAGLTKGQGFLPLTEARQVPAGSQIDARSGSLQLTAASARHRGKPYVGTFNGAIFKATQNRSGVHKGLTSLKLVEGAFPGAPSYASCPAASAGDRSGPSARAAKKSRKNVLQTLGAKATGNFGVTGSYAAGVVRGTVWTTTDRCDGTLIAVQRDTVQVTNLVTRAVVLVHAGHSYLAKARPRKHSVVAITTELRAIERLAAQAAATKYRTPGPRSSRLAGAQMGVGSPPLDQFWAPPFARGA